jgi:hypothetical protein
MAAGHRRSSTDNGDDKTKAGDEASFSLGFLDFRCLQVTEADIVVLDLGDEFLCGL